MIDEASSRHEKELDLVRDLSMAYSPFTFFRNWGKDGFVAAIKEDLRLTGVRYSSDARRLKKVYALERVAHNAQVRSGEISEYYEYESPLDFAIKRNRTSRGFACLKPLSVS